MIKKIFSLGLILLILSGCGNAKKAQNSLTSGDYDQAFELAYSELYKDKFKKSHQKLIPTLKEAFDKSIERDEALVKEYKKANNPKYLKNIYSLYTKMDVRQDDVRSLLPLSFEDKEVKFNFKDYSSQLTKAQNDYAEYLYKMAMLKINGSITEAREAYELLNELEFVKPSHVANLGSLIDKAKMNGSSLLLVQLQNKMAAYTNQDQINELLRISESNLSNPWLMIDTEKDYNKQYDYNFNVSLNNFSISPEQVNSEVVQQQARVNDGWEYVLDGNGNVLKDSLGNDIKREKIITVYAEVKLFQQLKTGRVDGTVDIIDINKNTKQMNELYGEAVFENIFAQYRGDQRAIEEQYYEALQNQEVPFPADSLFVKYSLVEFKNKMMSLLDSQNF